MTASDESLPAPQNSSTPVNPPRPEFSLGGTQLPQVAVSLQSHSGPLPPPSALAAYGEIDPSFPNRIMTMAEQNAASARTTAERAQHYQLAESIISRAAGLIFAVVAIIAAVILALNGQAVVAGVIGGATVVGVVTALIKGRPP